MREDASNVSLISIVKRKKILLALIIAAFSVNLEKAVHVHLMVQKFVPKVFRFVKMELSGANVKTG